MSNVPVPTGNLPVPYNPVNPAEQLALMAGPQPRIQATYTRPGQMLGLPAGPGPGGMPWTPRTAPSLLDTGGNLLQRGGSVGVGGPRFNPGAIPQLGNFAPTLASQAANKGNLMSRIGGAIKTGGAFGPLGKWGRVGLVAGAPVLGGFLSNQVGGQESILGRLLAGAGTGAGIGSIGGPWGMLGGAVLGGVGNALFGEPDEKVDFAETLDKVLSQGGFSEDDATEIKLMYSILKETKSEEEAKSAIGDIIMNDMQMREQAQLASEDAQSRMLATQALTAQFFQPFTQQLLDSAQQRYAVTESVANSLPAEYRGIARAQNAASLDNATRVANAYASQVQLIPAMSAMQQQQGMADQLAQQQAAQVMASLGIGGQGSGGGSLVDLIASQATGQ